MMRRCIARPGHSLAVIHLQEDERAVVGAFALGLMGEGVTPGLLRTLATAPAEEIRALLVGVERVWDTGVPTGTPKPRNAATEDAGESLQHLDAVTWSAHAAT